MGRSADYATGHRRIEGTAGATDKPGVPPQFRGRDRSPLPPQGYAPQYQRRPQQYQQPQLTPQPQYPPPQGYYAPQQPLPPQQPPRKSRKGFAFLGCGGLGALVILIAVIAGSKSSSSSAPAAAPAAGAQQAQGAAPPPQSAAPAKQAAAQTVTYVVTESDADVTYGPAGTDLSGTIPKRVTKPLGTPLYYAIQAQLQGGGSVSCQILVDGTVISSSTATGGYNIAQCEIGQDPLSGKWEDDN